MPIPRTQTIEFNLPHLLDHWARTLGDACWPWPWGRSANGYGQIVQRGRLTSAHRVAYEMVKGPIPAGLVTDHLCFNRACVNPSHLEAVTQQANVQRARPSTWYRKPRKTHCKHGHAFDVVNTFWQANGAQGCRMCHRLKARVKHGWQGNLPTGERTHCKHGHEFTTENTIRQTRRRGGSVQIERVCRTCVREKSRAYRAARRSA